MVERSRQAQFLRRVHNRPALRRKSSFVVFLQLSFVSSGLAVGGTIGYLANDYLVAHRTFELARLDLEATPEALRARVSEALAPAFGIDLLSVDIEALRERLERIPEVRSASVRRLLPDGIAVEVQPHDSWGRLRTRDGLFLVARNGIILGAADDTHADLPELRVDAELLPLLDARRRLPGDQPAFEHFGDAVRIVDWLAGEGVGQFGTVAGFRLDHRGVILVPADGSAPLLLGGAANLAEKAGRVRALEAHEVPPGTSLVDLRYRDMVVVRDLETVASGRQE